MAAPIVRPIAFYWAGRKAAEASSVDVSFAFNREGLASQDGWLAWSKGLAKMKITVSDIVPTSGSFTTRDLQKMFAQEEVECSVILGGEFYKQSMAVISADYKSEYEKGTTTGQVVLEGPAPKT